MSEEKSVVDGWAVVELMGHRRLGGRISEQVIAGAPMLRIDVPKSDGDGFTASQFYGGGAIFSLTPCSEEAARVVANHNQPEPVSRWELPPARAAGKSVIDADRDHGPEY